MKKAHPPRDDRPPRGRGRGHAGKATQKRFDTERHLFRRVPAGMNLRSKAMRYGQILDRNAQIRGWMALLPAIWVLGSCASNTGTPFFERFDPTLSPVPADHPDSPGVVMGDRGVLRFILEPQRTPRGQLKRYRRVKILRANGLSLATPRICHGPFARIRQLRARLVHRSGQTTTSKAIRETPHPSGGKCLDVAFSGAQPGDIVEVTYLLDIPDLRFLEPWTFQSALPTLRSEFVAVVPGRFDVDFRASAHGRFVDDPPERFSTDEGTRFVWTKKDLPPLFYEDDMPEISLVSPQVHVLFLSAQLKTGRFSGYRTWADLKSWLTTLTTPRAPEPKAPRHASQTVKTAHLTLASVQNGTPNHRFRQGEQRRWGPENDPVPGPANTAISLGMELIAQLRARGITAYPALHGDRRRSLLMADRPNTAAISGVLAFVPESPPLLLDPLTLTADLSVAPPVVQGTQIVVYQGDKPRVYAVPPSRPQESRTTLQIELTMDADGAFAGHYRLQASGAEAGTLRARLWGAKGREREAVLAFLKRRNAQAGVDTVTVENLRDPGRPLRIRGRVQPGRLRRDPTGGLYGTPGALLGETPAPARTRRRTPRVFPAPNQVEVTCRLKLPPGYEHGPGFAPLTETWDGGGLSFSYDAADDQVAISRLSIRRTLSIGVSENKDYRRFLKAQRSIELAEILIAKPTGGASDTRPGPSGDGGPP